MEKIMIAKDFAEAPGARYRTDGDKSGEEFYEDILKPKFEAVLKKGGTEKLFIDLDDTLGYPSSFLSETFGRLHKDFKNIDIWDYIQFKSDDSDSLVELIKELANEYE